MSAIPRYADGWEAMAAHPELSTDSWPCGFCGEPGAAHSDMRGDDPDRRPGQPGFYFDPHPDIDLHPHFGEEEDA